MQEHPITFFKKEDDSKIYELIKSKIINHSEVVVSFFDYCNMRCSFCPQDHESKIGMTKEGILSKIPFILDYMDKNKSNRFLFHLMGGELFQDELIEAGFLDYYSEFIDLTDVSKERIIDYNFITNLVFTKTEEIQQFLQKHNLKIAISYDPVARFSKPQLEQFKKNIEIFKPYIRMFSCVITKQNIKAILEGDEYFDYLYDNFDCHWDYLLVGNDKLDKMMPTQSEVFSFYKHLVDNYPRVMNVQQYFDNSQNKMGCTRGNTFTILADNSKPVGCSGAVILSNKKTDDIWSTKIIKNFIEENHCLSCEYYQRCNLSCFVNNDYKKIVKDIDGCVYKKVFEYVESRNEY
jgi:sulfatase maturation enzyme AslB (radical SAM superfamily)